MVIDQKDKLISITEKFDQEEYHTSEEVVSMMGWGYTNMMGSGWGVFGIVGLLFWVVLYLDAVLLGIWLWKQIQKGGR